MVGARSAELFGVGVGPGDPELVTIKAARLIAQADVVASFRAVNRVSNARRVVADLLEGGREELDLVYPVTVEDISKDEYERVILAFYDEASERIAVDLAAGRTVAVLCEGDPLFFGSFMYVRNRLVDRFPITVVPGVTSVAGAASQLGMPLVCRNEVFSAVSGVLPADELKTRLAAADVAVVMKLGRNLPKVRRVIEELDLLDRAWYVERATMAEQVVCPLAEADPATAPYFSMVVIPSLDAGAR